MLILDVAYELENKRPQRAAGPEPAELLTPVVERRIRYTHLAADLFDRRSELGLLQCERDLLFRLLRLLHDMTVPSRALIMPEIPALNGSKNRVSLSTIL